MYGSSQSTNLYGQKGCGKTFTMEGKEEPAELRGIIPQAFDHIDILDNLGLAVLTTNFSSTVQVATHTHDHLPKSEGTHASQLYVLVLCLIVDDDRRDLNDKRIPG